MKSAGLHTLPLHNHVLTLGEWGWIIGSKQPISKLQLQAIDLPNIDLKWLNQESLYQISSFGKPLVDTSGLEINTLLSPKLYSYYQKGNWNLF